MENYISHLKRIPLVLRKKTKTSFKNNFKKIKNLTKFRARLAMIFKSVSTLKNTLKCFWDENKVFDKF